MNEAEVARCTSGRKFKASGPNLYIVNKLDNKPNFWKNLSCHFPLFFMNLEFPGLEVDKELCKLMNHTKLNTIHMMKSPSKIQW